MRHGGSLFASSLIAIFSFSVSAISVPPISLTSIVNQPSFKFDSGIGVCDPPPISTETCPTFSDCGNAIRRLPNDFDKGTFHTDGQKDTFRLPIYESWGSCIVAVVLGGRETVTDKSSWLEISLAAIELNEVCRVGEITGGKIMAGATNKIWIKLDKVDFTTTPNGEKEWDWGVGIDTD